MMSVKYRDKRTVNNLDFDTFVIKIPDHPTKKKYKNKNKAK